MVDDTSYHRWNVSRKDGVAMAKRSDRHPSGDAEPENAQPEPSKYWQDWEVTSDEDVERDTLSEARQRTLSERYGVSSAN